MRDYRKFLPECHLSESVGRFVILAIETRLCLHSPSLDPLTVSSLSTATHSLYFFLIHNHPNIQLRSLGFPFILTHYCFITLIRTHPHSEQLPSSAAARPVEKPLSFGPPRFHLLAVIFTSLAVAMDCASESQLQAVQEMAKRKQSTTLQNMASELQILVVEQLMEEPHENVLGDSIISPLDHDASLQRLRNLRSTCHSLRAAVDTIFGPTYFSEVYVVLAEQSLERFVNICRSVNLAPYVKGIIFSTMTFIASYEYQKIRSRMLEDLEEPGHYLCKLWDMQTTEAASEMPFSLMDLFIPNYIRASKAQAQLREDMQDFELLVAGLEALDVLGTGLTSVCISANWRDGLNRAILQETGLIHRDTDYIRNQAANTAVLETVFSALKRSKISFEVLMLRGFPYNHVFPLHLTKAPKKELDFVRWDAPRDVERVLHRLAKIGLKTLIIDLYQPKLTNGQQLSRLRNFVEANKSIEKLQLRLTRDENSMREVQRHGGDLLKGSFPAIRNLTHLNIDGMVLRSSQLINFLRAQSNLKELELINVWLCFHNWWLEVFQVIEQELSLGVFSYYDIKDQDGTYSLEE